MKLIFFSLCLLTFSNVMLAQNTQLYWGDTHLHTSNSTDAFENGQTNADLETAYRFARGLPIIHPATGQRVQVDRALDFLVVADHAELLGLANRLNENDPVITDKPVGKRLRSMLEDNPSALWGVQISISLSDNNQDVLEQLHVPDVIQGAWNTQIEAADKHNSPHEFTALIGWEWSSSTNNINLHRVIFTPDNGDIAKTFLPFSSYDSDRPEDLWAWLDKTNAETGARLLAIPHNSNISDGLMFSDTDSLGEPMTVADARSRQRWEPVMEVTQYKGTSEVHPVLAPTDEFANFELREFLFNSAPAKPASGSYARSALKTGLALEDRLGLNPYKFGMIGSTDSHTGMVSVEENNFMGKTGLDFLPSQRPDKALTLMSAWEVSASGLAAVWATENTRDGIFNAFQKKEVYSTSGPRISLRVFGGFDFSNVDTEQSDIASEGYRLGVPMGSDLTAAPQNKPLSLLIEAMGDSQGANLDRIQVIKGWQDNNGSLQERVFNVRWAGERSLDSNGNLAAVGNTVDINSASYSNSIGSPRLAVVWQDPEFNPDLRAFYYVRVLEIPTPRHHIYDAVALGIDPETANPSRPSTIQDRAWSSPIWYTP